jgi:TPR repeat protein
LSPAEQVRELWSEVGQGNTSAEVTLAKLYLIGGRVKKNCDQARVLLKAAAKKHNSEAITKLSQITRQGCP